MKLMVIDGNSIVNRAFYGIRPLTTREGLYTNGIFGFLTTMLRLTEEEKPEALCVTFDLHAPTFRHKADAAYKATRHGMPEELRQQMPVLREVLAAMRIPVYTLEGFEADDLIGTISRRCEASGWDCCIVTGDRDSLQLITEHTRVRLTASQGGKAVVRDMTRAAFEEEYGFPPIRLIDLKALMGDSSDNISGVPGIGEKTAKELLCRYDGIDALYDALHSGTAEAKASVLRKLEEGEAAARQSFFLARIVTDAPLDFSPEDCLRKPCDPSLRDLLLRLELFKLIDRMGLDETAAAEPEEEREITVHSVVRLRTVAEAMEALRVWRDAPSVTVLPRADLSALAVLADTPDGTAAWEIYENDFEGNREALLRSLFSADIRKVSHGVKDLSRTLLHRGLPAEGFLFDTALAGYLLDATSGHYEIERLFATYFAESLPKPLYAEEDAFAEGKDTAEAEATLLSYTAAVSALYGYQEPLIEERGQTELLQTIEMPLCRVLAEMEETGCRVDTEGLRVLSEELRQESENTEAEIYELAGRPFSVNSPQQLAAVLFEEQGLPHGKKTKTGFSTDAETLEGLRGYPLVDKVLAYRQLTKLKRTYCDGLLAAAGADGRVHTNFQMTATATGRLSSTEPNLQNIPTRTERGNQLRRLCTAGEGMVLVDADYSQIELRVLAHIAEDERMTAMFKSGVDIHTETASEVFGVPKEQVTPQLRRNAKAVNFGIVYGISAYSLSRDIGVGTAEAKAYMDAYLSFYEGVKAYRERVVEQARERGWVETMWHRRRDMPELRNTKKSIQSFGERVALNMPIQGTAADIIKLAMVRVSERLRNEGYAAKLILQIHDELIVECPEAEAEGVCRLLTEEMERVTKLRLPLVAESHSGRNWAEAKGETV